MEERSSKQQGKYLQRPYGKKTILACPSNKKMTCRFQEQTELGKETKNEIREETSVSKRESFYFILI